MVSNVGFEFGDRGSIPSVYQITSSRLNFSLAKTGGVILD